MKNPTRFRPVRPLKPFGPTNPVPFDPRTSTFIPELSIDDVHVRNVNARKLSTFGVKVFRSTAQTIADATPTNIAFDMTAFDQGNFFDASVDDETLTVPFTGIYHVTAFVEFETNTTGDRRLTIVVDGTNDVSAATPAPNLPWRNVATAPMLLEAGTTLQAEVSQTSTGNLDINMGEENNFLSAILAGHV
jgi:hypothetical protein